MTLFHRFPMVQVDVFTAVRLEGNALAVFTEARGIHVDEMHAIARETNLSETVFLIRSDVATERRVGIRARIFTPREELPFAGHPTLGAAWVLREEVAATGAPRPAEIHLSLDVGKITVRWIDDGPDGAPFGEMTQLDPSFLPAHDHGEVARVLGLPAEALDASLPVQTVSTGVPFTIVPLRTLAAVQALTVDQAAARPWIDAHGGGHFYFVTRETVDPSALLHARMPFEGGEDPATGSGAGCAAAWAVAHGVANPEQRFLVEQGLEVKRPSRIHVRAGHDGDRVVNVRVGGSVVPVLKGIYDLE
jgi:trans-2,3-dihydro-3-hydroxyanthranilate isomerase